MFGILGALRSAREMQSMADEQQRIARLHYEQLMRNFKLMGRTFKCGPLRWRIDPKHADVHGRPLSPEIKVTWLTPENTART